MNMDAIYAQIDRERREEFLASEQISLGTLIAGLKACNKTQSGTPKRVRLTFDGVLPTDVNTWRGSYRELAIGFDVTDHVQVIPTVESLLKILDDAVGRTFQGYKGGDFLMTSDTPVWVANWGNSEHNAVIGVSEGDWEVTIQTKEMEY